MAGERTELGAADVDDAVLRAMVGGRLGASRTDIELLSVRIETVDYDLSAITTGGRWWVRGEARVDGVIRPWSFFVKVMQSWSRSPLFEMVPEDIREVAAASVPWRTESLVYRSDLATRLPDGLLMPAAHGVFDLDEASASIWLEEVEGRPRGAVGPRALRARRAPPRPPGGQPGRRRARRRRPRRMDGRRLPPRSPDPPGRADAPGPRRVAPPAAGRHVRRRAARAAARRRRPGRRPRRRARGHAEAHRSR